MLVQVWSLKLHKNTSYESYIQSCSKLSIKKKKDENENLASTPDTLLGFACFKHGINIQENNNKQIG